MLTLATLGAGCGDVEAPLTDAGTPADAGDAAVDAGTFGPSSVRIEDPVAPSLPQLDCPTGFRSVPEPLDDDSTIEVCEPWPVEGRRECEAGAFHLPGGEGCEPIGPACAGDFAPDLPATGVLYVQPGSAGGDGSVERPFATIDEALAVASSGTIVALSLGIHPGPEAIEVAVEFRGACVMETVIRCTGEGTRSCLGFREVTGGASNLSIESTRTGIFARGGTFTGRHLLISARTAGFQFVAGVRATGARIAIHDTAPALGGGFGRAIDVQSGAQVDFSEVSILRARDVGVSVSDPDTSLILTRSVVADTLVRERDGWFGRGLAATEGARLEVRQSAIEGNRHDCLFLSGAGTEGVLLDSVLRDTAPTDTMGYFGSGIHTTQGAMFRAERSVIQRNVAVGVLVGNGGRAQMNDILMLDGTAQPVREFAIGLQVSGGGQAEIERAIVARGFGSAVVVTEPGSSLIARDLVVFGTAPAGEGDGRGISVSKSAVASFERVHVRGSASYGVVVLRGGQIEVQDVRVSGVAPRLSMDLEGYGLAALENDAVINGSDVLVEGAQGIGLIADSIGSRIDLSRVQVVGPVTALRGFGLGALAQHGGTVSLSTASIRQTTNIALYSNGDGALLEATHISVEDVRPRLDGLFGTGLHVHDRARATVTDGRIHLATGYGVLAFGDADVSLTAVDVSATKPHDCDRPICEGGGIGVTSVGGSRVTAEGLSSRDNALCGLQVALGGDLTVHRGVVSGQPIGINVRVEGFDLDAQLRDVVFSANQRPVDSLELPLPEQGDPLPGS